MLFPSWNAVLVSPSEFGRRSVQLVFYDLLATQFRWCTCLEQLRLRS